MILFMFAIMIYSYILIIKFINNYLIINFNKKITNFYYKFVIFTINSFQFLIILFFYKFSVQAFLYYTLLCLLLTLSVIDIHTKFVSNKILIIILFLGIINVLNNFNHAISSIIGFFIISAPLLIIAITTNGIGGGDIKLFAVLGFILGWKLTLICGFLTFVIAGIYGSVILIKKYLFKGNKYASELPLVPFIHLSTLITILFSNEILFILYQKYNTI